MLIDRHYYYAHDLTHTVVSPILKRKSLSLVEMCNRIDRSFGLVRSSFLTLLFHSSSLFICEWPWDKGPYGAKYKKMEFFYAIGYIQPSGFTVLNLWMVKP